MANFISLLKSDTIRATTTTTKNDRKYLIGSLILFVVCKLDYISWAIFSLFALPHGAKIDLFWQICHFSFRFCMHNFPYWKGKKKLRHFASWLADDGQKHVPASFENKLSWLEHRHLARTNFGQLKHFETQMADFYLVFFFYSEERYDLSEK